MIVDAVAADHFKKRKPRASEIIETKRKNWERIADVGLKVSTFSPRISKRFPGFLDFIFFLTKNELK